MLRIQQLTEENGRLLEQLKTAEGTIDRQLTQIEKLTLQLGESERTLVEREEDMETLDKTSKDQVCIYFIRLLIICSSAVSPRFFLN